MDHIGHRGSSGSSSGSLAGSEVTASLPLSRQTLFFSATWPREVQAVARALCRNDPMRVFVGGSERKLVANRNITQRVQVGAWQVVGHCTCGGGRRTRWRHAGGAPTSHTYPAHTHRFPHTQILGSESDKLPALRSYLQQQPWHQGARVIIFTSTKRTADWLEHTLVHDSLGGAAHGLRAVAVHGNKGQRQREGALAAFRSGRAPVLVATDVAARGLDIPGVTLVVNYDFPTEIEM